MARSRIISTLARLRRSDEGAALVEFGVVLPIMLLFFGVMIEGARTYWSYQATIAGVRDAVRYVGRSAQAGICVQGGNLGSYGTKVTEIVRETSSGTALFPSSITVVSVTPTLICVSGAYRLPETPIAQISAQLQITYPFQSLFDLVGVTLPSANATVTDQSRIFGA